MSSHLIHARTVDLEGPVVVAPVGAVVNAEGYGFTLEPVALAEQPYRIRCLLCPWQGTVVGLAAAPAAIDRHALAHQVDPRPDHTPLTAGGLWRRLAGGAR